MLFILVDRDTGVQIAGTTIYATPREAAAAQRSQTTTSGRAAVTLVSTHSDAAPTVGDSFDRTCTLCGNQYQLTPENFRWRRTYGPRFGTRCLRCEREIARVRRARGPRPDATATRRASTGVRRFGVELEANCPFPALRAAVDARPELADWDIRGDGSLGARGVEFVSPPLDAETGFGQVRIACEAMIAAGATVDYRCGLHVHVDASGLSAATIRRIVKGYCDSQDVIDGLLSHSRRENRNTYCSRWNESALERLETSRTVSDMSRLTGRYVTVNIGAYPRHGTIEFRQHQGTISFRKVEAWVRFILALVATATRADVPACRSVVGLMSATGVDEDAAAFLIGRAVQFGHVPIQDGIGGTPAPADTSPHDAAPADDGTVETPRPHVVWRGMTEEERLGLIGERA